MARIVDASFFSDTPTTVPSTGKIVDASFFAPEPETGFLSGLKQFGSGAVEGIAGLGGLAVDVAQQFANLGGYNPQFKVDEETGQVTQKSPWEDMFKWSGLAQEAVQPIVAEKPTELGGKFLRTAGSFAVPGGVVGKVSKAKAIPTLISDIAGAGGFTLGEEAFPDSTAIPIISSILAGSAPQLATSLTKSVARPFTKTGQEVIAGEELLRNAGIQGRSNIEDLLAGRTTAQTPFGAKTYAEIANTPSASAYQEAMRKIPSEGTDALEASLVARQGLRTKELQKIAPDAMKDITPSTRGATIQARAEELANAELLKAGDPYDLIDTKIQIPVQKAKYSVGSIENKLFKDTSLPMGADTRKIVDNFLVKDKEMPVSKLLALKSDAGRVIGNLRRTDPRSRDIVLLGELRSKIDKSLDDAMHSGVIPPKQTDLIDSARQNYAFVNTKYGNKLTKEITTRGGLDAGYQVDQAGQAIGRGFKTRQELIPSKIIANEDNARQWRMTFGDDKELMNQGKSALIDDMAKKDPSTWAKYYKDKQGVFKEVFWKENKDVKRIIDDLASEKSVGEMASRASKGQSGTAQFTSALDKVRSQGFRPLLRLAGQSVGATGLAGGLVGSWGGALVGAGLSKASKWADDNIQSLVMEAIKDPETLKLLAKKATPTVNKQLAKKLAPLVAMSYARSQESEKPKELTRLKVTYPSNVIKEEKPMGATENKKTFMDLLAQSGITDPKEVNQFLAQVDHESGGFKHLKELGSGAKYEGRKDLGNTEKGDGEKYKGRGYIQLTGKYNYKKYGDKLGIDLVNNPELAEDPAIAFELALAYWNDRVKPKVKDFDDVKTVTRIINGGFNGLSDRAKKYALYTSKNKGIA